MTTTPGQGEIDFTAAFRAVLGPGARRQLADEVCVSFETAKSWFSGAWPACRKTQLTDLLIQRVETRQKILDEIRRAALGSRNDRR